MAQGCIQLRIDRLILNTRRSLLILSIMSRYDDSMPTSICDDLRGRCRHGDMVIGLQRSLSCSCLLFRCVNARELRSHVDLIYWHVSLLSYLLLLLSPRCSIDSTLLERLGQAVTTASYVGTIAVTTHPTSDDLPG